MLRTELINELLEKYPNVTIIGVTKYTDEVGVKEFRDKGITNIGENRTESFLPKYDAVDGVTWHLIGSLQTKKVKKVINKIDYLHSLDRLSLAEEIEKRADHKVKCLIEVKTTHDDKHGLTPDEVPEFMEALKQFTKIEVVGFMTMAEDTNDETSIRESFRTLRKLKETFHLKELSMGMSNDFEIAIEEGATMIRLGRMLYEEM